MVEIIQSEKDGVPVIMSVASKEESEVGIIESVEWEVGCLPYCARQEFLKAAGIRMPEDLNKPGTHDRVMAALRVALTKKDVLRQLTDQIVRATKEAYDAT